MKSIYLYAFTLGGTLGLSSANLAATISLTDLGSQSATNTINTTGTIANGTYNDGTVDGDSNVASTADITFAWEMTLKRTEPQPIGSRRVIAEFGGGNGTGLSVTWFGDSIYASVEQGAEQLAGDGSGSSDALKYTVTASDLNVETAWVVSLDVDATNPRMNLFKDGELIGSVSANASITDWAGTNDGGFWARGGNSLLLETFGNGSGAVGPSSSDATPNLSTGLRLYEDTFVATVPEPGSLALLGLGGLLVARRRRS